MYTPGPWHVAPVHYPDRAHPEVYASTRRIARPCTSDAVPSPESDANAQLIAAAPDLLAACEAVLIGWTDHSDLRDQVQAAVAKAHGVTMKV